MRLSGRCRRGPLGAAAVAALVPALASGAPRPPGAVEIFKGPMDPNGKIRFSLRESPRGKAPRLDRFDLRFDCNDGLGQGAQGYGATAGGAIRPDRKGRFRIRAIDPGITFVLSGDFNRNYTSAAGSFRIEGNLGDGVHGDCDSGKLAWRASVQP